MGFSIPRVYTLVLLATAVAVVSIVIGTSSNLFSVQNACADGFSERTFTASFQGRNANLLVKVNPPTLTSETKQDAFILFRLYDSNTNQTIKFTSLFISITKDNKELINDLFQSAEGVLRLKIQPDETASKVSIYGNKEGFLDAWVADPCGTVNVEGPILVEGGLYRIHVEVYGIDSPKNIFPVDNITKFDAYLSVGDIFHREITDISSGQTYNISIISYYDKISSFEYDQESKAISWSIPFNYNLSRIKNEPDIFVHEEVRIPKSIRGISDSLSFAGTVNGKQLPCSLLAIDPYSSNTEMIVHFLIGKGDILKLAEQYNITAKESNTTLGFMEFTLFGSKQCPHETSTKITTDTGGINVLLQWMPSQLKQNTEENVTLQFLDATSESALMSDVKYDFVLSDMAGNTIFRMDNLVAQNATDTIAFRTPVSGEYSLQVFVRGLVTNSSNGSIEDNTRNGRALGYVSVP